MGQALASLTVFAHPDVVTALKARAVFRTVRGQPKGALRGNVVLDDNASPAAAFTWSTGLKPGSDMQCCHLYAASRDPAAYTDVRNICYTPAFLAKLMDTQEAKPSIDHPLHILRYRAFDLYGFEGPKGQAALVKPPAYDALCWPAPLGKGATWEEMSAAFRLRLSRRRRDRLAKAARLAGWTFSNYLPDPAVQYLGLPF